MKRKRKEGSEREKKSTSQFCVIGFIFEVSTCFDKRANDPKGIKMYHSDQNTLGNLMYEQPLTILSYYAEIWGHDALEVKITGKY